MNILQLIYVLEVAKYHNVSKAASRLYLSQSALSQQISRLEKELGYELFSRASHGFYLTERGRQFCDAAQPAVDSWQQFQRSIGFENSRCKKNLRIAMGSRVYSNGLFQDIASFFDNLPDLEVTFITEAGFDYLAGLKDGSIDLALDRLPPHSLMNDCPVRPHVSYGSKKHNGVYFPPGIAGQRHDNRPGRLHRGQNAEGNLQKSRHIPRARIPFRRYTYGHKPYPQRQGGSHRAPFLRFILWRSGSAAQPSRAGLSQLYLPRRPLRLPRDSYVPQIPSRYMRSQILTASPRFF